MHFELKIRQRTGAGSRLMAAVGVVVLAGLASISCRSAYGIDPVTQPDLAAKTPGVWNVSLTGGTLGFGEFERYHVEYDGAHAWVLATQNVRPRGYRQWSRELTPAEFASFAKSALALDPFSWSDHSAPSYGSYETMRLFFQAGDRGRSVVLEGPSLEDIVFLDRFRLLAGEPPAATGVAATK
jgi:hypothetical protein